MVGGLARVALVHGRAVVLGLRRTSGGWRGVAERDGEGKWMQADKRVR